MEVLSDIYLSDEASFGSMDAIRDDLSSSNNASHIPSNTAAYISNRNLVKKNTGNKLGHAAQETPDEVETSKTESCTIQASHMNGSAIPMHTVPEMLHSTENTPFKAILINPTITNSLPCEQTKDAHIAKTLSGKISTPNATTPVTTDEETQEKHSSIAQFSYDTTASNEPLDLSSHTADTDDEIVEITDYYASRNGGTDPTAPYEAHNYSSDEEVDNDDIFDTLSADFSDLEVVGRDETYIRIPHEIKRSYSSSEESFGEAEIESLDDDLCDSLTDDASDLELVQRDETYIRLPQMIQRTYSSSEESFGEAEIETLDDSDRENTCTDSEERMDELCRFGVYMSSESETESQDRNTRKDGDEDLESWGSEDINVSRGCEVWLEIPPPIARTYSSSEESFGESEMNAMNREEKLPMSLSSSSSNESIVEIYVNPRFRHQETPQNRPVSGESRQARKPPSYQGSEEEKGADVSDKEEVMESGRKRGKGPENRSEEVTRGKKEVTENGSGNLPEDKKGDLTKSHHSGSSTCDHSFESQTSVTKKRDILKRVGRLFSKCFGRTNG